MLGSTNNLETLRNEVYQLQRELLQERTKVRALSEELENPINVHRWRKLEGSDPATYELVQKIHMLQRRLIEKSEEVVDKELLIHHKEKLYLELKNILARQPGPEVAEQLSLYQHSLQERGRQTEQMGSELSMLHAQAGEYKYERDWPRDQGAARDQEEVLRAEEAGAARPRRPARCELAAARGARARGARHAEQVHGWRLQPQPAGHVTAICRRYTCELKGGALVKEKSPILRK